MDAAQGLGLAIAGSAALSAALVGIGELYRKAVKKIGKGRSDEEG